MPVTNYVWDPLSDNVLLETDENDVTQAVYTQEPDTFGNLISQRRDDETSWYHFDGLGSTRELTNNLEEVTDTNMYDAWGVNVASTGTTGSPFHWVGEAGYYDDPETGDYYVRARMYRPEIARWLSVDPLQNIDTFDPYIYSRNNPNSHWDPSGQVECLRERNFGVPWTPQLPLLPFQNAAFTYSMLVEANGDRCMERTAFPNDSLSVNIAVTLSAGRTPPCDPSALLLLTSPRAFTVFNNIQVTGGHQIRPVGVRRMRGPCAPHEIFFSTSIICNNSSYICDLNTFRFSADLNIAALNNQGVPIFGTAILRMEVSVRGFGETKDCCAPQDNCRPEFAARRVLIIPPAPVIRPPIAQRNTAPIVLVPIHDNQPRASK